MHRSLNPPPSPSLRRRTAESLMGLAFGKPATREALPLPAKGMHRILICHVCHTLGNAVLLTPLLQELAQHYPGAEVDIVTRSQAATELYGHHLNVRQLYVLPAHGVGHAARWLAQWRAVQRQHYDLAIDPDPKSHTGRLFLLRARARYKLGFDSPDKSGNLTHSAPLTLAPESKGQRPVFLLRHAMGLSAEEKSHPVPDIALTGSERANGKLLLNRLLGGRLSPASRGVVGIFANATGHKRLDITWWTPFLDRLEALLPGYQFVEIVPADGRSLLENRYPSYFSSHLRRLASVLAALDAYASADCGVMHLACASGTSTYGIFNTTRAEEWGPYGPGNHVVHAYQLTPAEAAEDLASLILAHAPVRAASPVQALTD